VRWRPRPPAGPPDQKHRLVRNLLIDLGDGVALSADLHLPESEGPHPTLVSLSPYRKDEIIGAFTAYERNWFAERGDAHLLVDVRGYGNSRGRCAESFDPILEAADAETGTPARAPPDTRGHA
jgi:predicted acyl esterase